MSERSVVKKIVQKALAADYRVSVNDGETFVLNRSHDIRAIMAVLFATDEEHLIIREATGKLLGRIDLIYGNSPEEVVADHTDNEAIRALVA